MRAGNPSQCQRPASALLLGRTRYGIHHGLNCRLSHGRVQTAGISLCVETRSVDEGVNLSEGLIGWGVRCVQVEVWQACWEQRE